MTFQYNYDQAKTQRITGGVIRSLKNYLNRNVAAILSDVSPDVGMTDTQAPDWFVERVLDAYYSEAPEFRGKLPRSWGMTIENVVLQDPLTRVSINFAVQVVPRVSRHIQSLLTMEELNSLGLFLHDAQTYDDAQKSMAPLIEFVKNLERKVPIVVLQRHPWILERFTSRMINQISDGYTCRMLTNYRAEFDSLPPRKDRQPTPPDNLLPALQLLDIIKLKEH